MLRVGGRTAITAIHQLVTTIEALVRELGDLDDLIGELIGDHASGLGESAQMS